jgi:hypothetical protein
MRRPLISHGCSALGLATLLSACSEEVPPPPKPGETCWALVERDWPGHEYCDRQFCLPKDGPSLTAAESSGPGFRCDDDSALCAQPTAEELERGEAAGWLFDAGEFSLYLEFDKRLLVEGYSLENFRTHFRSVAIINFDPDLAFEPQWGVYALAHLGASPPRGSVEIVSYDNGVLRVKVEGAWSRVREPISTPPYLCGASSGAPTYMLCESTVCPYHSEDESSEGSGESVRVTADVAAPVQAPAPKN